MKHFFSSHFAKGSAALAAALLCGASVNAQEDILIPGGPIPHTVRPLLVTPPQAEATADVLVTLVADVEEENVEEESGKTEASEGSYWLGIQVSPLPEIAKKQLGVEQGLAVGDVVAESPAAKAGIERYDILTKVNGTPLADLPDLVKAVEVSLGQEMTITLLRAGKEQTLKATAAKAKKATLVEVPVVRPELAQEIRRIEEALSRLRAEAGEKGLGLYFPRPAIVPPKIDARIWQGVVEKTKADLPKDVSVSISKEGDQPAKIQVKKGDKKWDTTEDKLGELPADVRPHVEKMLGQGLPVRVRTTAPMTGARTLRVGPDGKVEGEIHLGPAIAVPPVPPLPPRASAAPVAPAAPRAPAEKAARAFSYRTERSTADDEATLGAILKKLEKLDRLDGVEKELRDLRKDVDNLRKSNKE